MPCRRRVALPSTTSSPTFCAENPPKLCQSPTRGVSPHHEVLEARLCDAGFAAQRIKGENLSHPPVRHRSGDSPGRRSRSALAPGYEVDQIVSSPFAGYRSTQGVLDQVPGREPRKGRTPVERGGRVVSAGSVLRRLEVGARRSRTAGRELPAEQNRFSYYDADEEIACS